MPSKLRPDDRRTLVRYLAGGELREVHSTRRRGHLEIVDQPVGSGRAMVVDRVPLSDVRLRPPARQDRHAGPSSRHAKRGRGGLHVPAADARPGAQRILASYTDDERRRHAIVSVATDQGRLVIDRREGPRGELRLVARVAPDEAADPAIDNESLITGLYLADPSRGRCRLLRLGDLHPPRTNDRVAQADTRRILDAGTARYRISEVASVRKGRPCARLRWVRCTPAGEPTSTVTMREVIGALESYEPVVAMTCAVVADCRGARGAPGQVLAAELAAMEATPFVLNRGLRQAAQSVVSGGLLLWSDIARNCGHVRDDNCGDTSWLKRRLGITPDGAGRPTPWVHHAVLAAIARDGLGMDPRSVEV